MIATWKPTQTKTPTFAKRGDAFYSSRKWRRFRHWYLARNALCRHCMAGGQAKAAEHVHHDKARKDHPELAFDEANMVALCASCHSKEEAARRGTPPSE